ncbi:Rhodanese domain protein [Rhodomicrobium vannielii ATCC 17100]|uniref:Rhodanese domain protein n=1 Tax=Rhodomicrobium vannielii (strain ATCC 17100 / DSM 162 / LMG 4299 / NCIMB 10020 / ATH 3.1.1) TaxID=648757 RepID=E3I1U1_RHOVT|nr:rhodanese-like domain-containing protein [Rhodomicrobium vannielii]ADP70160.1 Rhodanese domain protein [Rhodomicrobium vannielii ATCC 17100]
MPIQPVNAASLNTWLESGDAVLVDVREPQEYAAEHVAGATLVPLGTVCCAKLPDYTGKKLVIMCKLGGRGGKACEKLAGELPPRAVVYNLDGGIEAWKKAGLPVERAPRRGFMNWLTGRG